MKIAVNARLLNERRGGPFRYLVNILNELAALDQTNSYSLIVNQKLKNDHPFLKNANFKLVVLPFKQRVIFDYIALPLYSFFVKNDLYVFPKTTFAPYIRGKKVPIFHDIIYYEKFGFREFRFFDNLHHKVMIKAGLHFSDMNISVSGFTASRMKELLGIRSEKIEVIYEGVESSFCKIDDKKYLAEVKARLGLESPFLFFAGSLSPRKNILTILKAFEKIKDTIPHNLYFTAGDSWNDSDVYRYILDHNLGDRVIKMGYLSEQDLVAVYNLASCYLYPSLYEGFGLPILEAQACGCPVITSNVSSCPEVAGDSAVLVDPYSADSLAEAIVKIVKNKSFAKELVRKGFRNIARFSWKKAAAEHLALFKRV